MTRFIATSVSGQSKGEESDSKGDNDNLTLIRSGVKQGMDKISDDGQRGLFFWYKVFSADRIQDINCSHDTSIHKY